MKIVNVKLSTGEEVIAKLANEDETTYSLISPRTLTLHQHQNGSMAAGFIPTMMLCKDDDIIVNKSSVVMFSFNVQKEYEDKYLESVSGLTLANTLRG